MAEFLGSASPALLLLCLAAPVIGAIILAGFLFVSFSGRNKKQAMNPGLPTETASFFSPETTFSKIFTDLPKQAAAPSITPATPEVTNPTFTPEVSLPELINPTDLDLNLNLLSQRSEMETAMMNHLSKSSHEPKAGLAARLGQRPVPEAAPTPPDPPAPALAVSTPPQAAINEPVKQAVLPLTPAEPIELLRLLRDPQSGQLLVEIAGRRYSKLAEIADKEIGQYILKLTAHLVAFTNGMIATEAGLKTLPAPKVGETPTPLVPAEPRPVTPPVQSVPAVAASVPQAPPDLEAAFLASLRAQPIAPEPPKPQRRGLFGRSKPVEEEPLLPPLNLAAQINQIAQARLRYSPLATTTRLEITSDPGGGIWINVNGQMYHGPEDIPQPEVKALIKDSIKEWERS
jgi:hypothetical protein